MLNHSRTALTLRVGMLLACLAPPAVAQQIDDGQMVRPGELLTGFVYSHDSWKEYWEGPLKRTNGNIGRITTQTNAWWANYGLSERMNIIAQVPHVGTNASQGVLHGIKGIQDLTLAAKYRFMEAKPGGATVRAFAVLTGGAPLTDYNPELLPLSIGLKSKRVSTRGTLNVETGPGWFANASAAYTWRSRVTLDRPYFFTNDEFVMSNRVDMPRTFDYMASAGLMRPRLMAAVFFMQQRTLGGGDIRRQDMPFVSNRMNVERVGGMAMLPVIAGVEVQGSVAYTLDGRNVGQSTTFSGGILYRFNRFNP
jgi:hypothetical protein